ncbi:phenolic glucoside malonyltransferase 2-like [Pyrus ussuriensis x Pyrus communis]|uniref:Phenolic glucoside malonyltransferase 2-like n=1 Tax=Pyrus ussuriensis x Pyrus communis TaxID=2448454 RepID=A0A5N5G5D3_9ROSA|nr:phenolic glucoside malonyltransferase 2-like [Pyrus ussuriensis x Pyrus communis]
MADLNSVKVVEVCKVAPRPSTPDSSAIPESLPLTLFDLLWLRFAPVQRLFFYEINNPNSSDTNFTHSTLIPKLKTSLSLTLQQFLPLAGNVIWPKESPKPILRYVRGDGVFLTIAESDNDFHHIVSSNSFNIEAKEYHPLIPQMPVSHEKAAAIALQITIFPNRGFCIGTSMHHAILDGKTSTMFVKTWAHICKHEDSNLLPEQLKPFFDRSVIKDPANLEEIYANQFRNMDRPDNRMRTDPVSPDLIRGTFQVTRTNLEALRQMVTAKKEQQEQYQSVHLSTFSLTCAYAWVCLVKVEEMKAGVSLFVFSVDCRSRFDPPLPANYFGNCLTGRKAVAETNGLLGEDGLIVAVSAISEAIKSLDEGVLKGAENRVSGLYSGVRGKDRTKFSVAGSHQFKIYGTDFGWGRPRKTDVVSIDRTEAISLADSKNCGGGVEIGLVLKKHHMDVFASLFAKGLESL